MIKQIAIAATLAILSSAAVAADQPYFYAGGDVGSTKVDDFDDRETSYGAFAGYQINQNFGIEAGYRSLADYDTTFLNEKVEVRGRQTSLSVIGTIPMGNGFSVYGRLGYNHISLKASTRFGSEKDSESKVLYGAGVSYAFTPTVSGRIEVQKPHSDLTNVSAGVSFRF